MEEQNPPENRNINTEGGNYNERIEGDYIQGNVFQNIFNILSGQQTTPVGNPARPKNERLLLAAVKEEVTSRLRQSLHNAVLINLGKESQPQQVKRPWDAEIKIGLKPPEPLPDTTTILQVFDSEEVAGKLLVLGAPGSGKTTTQLELAQALVSRAEEQPDYPLPVLFNLSSWKDNRQSITDWLVVELKSKYGISKKLGQQWVKNRKFLLLLDGLDELEPQSQEICVHEINKFLANENKPLYLVICSRSEEYTNYSTQLKLNGAIYLQPLTNYQICDYLTSINYIELWSIISSDLDILELVKTPLLLTITVLVFQEISVEKWQHLISTADRIQYLLNAYIERMLTRNIRSRAYLKNKTPNAKQTRRWLIWLVQQMQRESKTEFLIEEIQTTWLISKTEKSSYYLIYFLNFFLSLGLIIGLMSWFILGSSLGLIIGLIIGLIGGLIGGLIPGIISGLFLGANPRKIDINEKIIFLKINKHSLFNQLIFVLPIGQILGLIISQMFSINGFIFGLSYLLLSILISNESDSVIENKKISNQGIWKSAYNAIFLVLTGGLIFLLIYELIYKQIYRQIYGQIFKFIFLGLIFVQGLVSGGDTCIQHLSLRLVFYFYGYIPWNYTRFLDYCTERLFLQRVGGRYRFIHKLLQDHFAQMEFKRNVD